MDKTDVLVRFVDSVVKAVQGVVVPPSGDFTSAIMLVVFEHQHPELPPTGVSLNYKDGEWTVAHEAFEGEKC
jgi:hypothetical protein